MGHNWKSSSRKRSDFEWSINHYDELSYVRKHCEGNPHYEYSRSWHYRCRCCRKQTREWWPLFIRQQLFNGLRSSWDHYHKFWPEIAKPDLTPEELKYYSRLRFFNSLSQFFIHQDWMWPALVDAALDLESRVTEKVYGKRKQSDKSD